MSPSRPRTTFIASVTSRLVERSSPAPTPSSASRSPQGRSLGGSMVLVAFPWETMSKRVEPATGYQPIGSPPEWSAPPDSEGLGRIGVDQDHLDLAPVAGVDRAGRVDQRDAVPGREARAGMDEGRVALGHGHGQPGPDHGATAR